MTKVLVAGATGLIGRRVVERLVEQGHEVAGFTADLASADALRAAGADALIGDALEREAVHRAVAQSRPDVVIHQLTAIPRVIEWRRAAEQFALTNRLRIEGTANLLDAARAAGARRLIAQSLAFGYAPEGDMVKDEDAPLFIDAPAPWGEIVEAAASLERQVMTAELEGVVLRYGALCGPGTTYAESGQFAEGVKAGNTPIIGDGAGVFSFTHVDDAAQAAADAIHPGPTGIFNIVDDTPVAAREWLPRYAETLGAPPPATCTVQQGLRTSGWLSVHRMTEQRGAHNKRAREGLGWEPSRRTWRESLLAEARAGVAERFDAG